MAAYCFSILGVRRRDIRGPRYDCNRPRGMRSPSANKRERKGPTSAVVDGPPMFMKTMAVGPVVEEDVTGGATVANRREARGMMHLLLKP